MASPPHSNNHASKSGDKNLKFNYIIKNLLEDERELMLLIQLYN